jgi:hypothetical protein
VSPQAWLDLTARVSQARRPQDRHCLQLARRPFPEAGARRDQRPTKFELLVNRHTAEALGVIILAFIPARANEVMN